MAGEDSSSAAGAVAAVAAPPLAADARSNDRACSSSDCSDSGSGDAALMLPIASLPPTKPLELAAAPHHHAHGRLGAWEAREAGQRRRRGLRMHTPLAVDQCVRRGARAPGCRLPPRCCTPPPICPPPLPTPFAHSLQTSNTHTHTHTHTHTRIYRRAAPARGVCAPLWAVAAALHGRHLCLDDGVCVGRPKPARAQRESRLHQKRAGWGGAVVRGRASLKCSRQCVHPLKRRIP